MDDLLSRKAVIDAINKNACNTRRILDAVEALPSVRPDVIPLEWIDKHLEWLDNCDNDFAQLAKVSIRAMVEIWKKDKT